MSCKVHLNSCNLHAKRLAVNVELIHLRHTCSCFAVSIRWVSELACPLTSSDVLFHNFLYSNDIDNNPFRLHTDYLLYSEKIFWITNLGFCILNVYFAFLINSSSEMTYTKYHSRDAKLECVSLFRTRSETQYEVKKGKSEDWQKDIGEVGVVKGGQQSVLQDTCCRL
jgi:hypothetical protein